MRRIKQWLVALLATVFVCLQPGLAHAAPEVGWWWNPDESGRGFFIEMKGSILFMAGYFYAEDGRGTWAVSGGPITDTNNYTGRLNTVRNGQTLVGPYKAPAAADVVDIGELSLHFTDDTHGTLTWPGGSIAIERQIFGAGSAAFQPSGWWWNPAESGRGFSIEVQGDTLDVVSFMYDEAGNPVWYISSGKMASPNRYVGKLEQIAGGQTMSGPYKLPTTVTPVGTITIDFASLETGTITLSDTLPPAAAGVALKTVVTIPVEPQLPNPPLADLPADWGGTYTGILVSDPPGVDILTATAEGDVTWVDAAEVPGNTLVFPATATPSRPFLISGGTATIHVSGTASVPVLGQSVSCSATGSATLSLATVFADSYLQFEANGVVTGQIATRTPIPFTVTATCATPVGPVVLSPQYPVSITVPISGRHRYGHSEGSEPLHPIAPDVSAGATWSFTGFAGP